MKSSIRIAVSGSNGQLGKEIARLVPEFPSFRFDFLTRENFPLEEPEKIQSWLQDNPVDWFIHGAAYTAVDKAESEKEKAWQINALAPGIIARTLSERQTPMIQVSTDYVFDGTSSVPLKEDAPTQPVNSYGESKLGGEKEVLKNNPQSLVIRTSWLYSAYGNNFVKTMIRLMREKDTIRVVNDQTGSPTYAGDLAAAILAIIGSGRVVPGIFHYSNEGVTNWHAFAAEIKKQINSRCNVLPIPSAGYPTPAKRPVYSLMDKSKIRKEYGLHIPDWQSSLAFCLEQIKKDEV